MYRTYNYIILISIIILINYRGTKSFIPQAMAKPMPLASFLFAHQDRMRIGWGGKGLFIQLIPREGEGEYRLSLRVLREGRFRYGEMKGYLNNRPLNGHRYHTFPFVRLKGAIQAEGLRALFPNDRAGAGGWIHQITYKWETPRLLAEAFLKDGVNPEELMNWNRRMGWLPPAQPPGFKNDDRLRRGESVLLPWKWVRDDLGFRPIALLFPLQVIKDDSGQRFAGYRLQPGETLYTNVVVRFTDMRGHEQVRRAVGDLLALNGLDDPRTIPPGETIKIPLEWIRIDFRHSVPSIHEHPERIPHGDYPRHDVGAGKICPLATLKGENCHSEKDPRLLSHVSSTHAS